MPKRTEYNYKLTDFEPWVNDSGTLYILHNLCSEYIEVNDAGNMLDMLMSTMEHRCPEPEPIIKPCIGLAKEVSYGVHVTGSTW